jgi:hypothetical protein
MARMTRPRQRAVLGLALALAFVTTACAPAGSSPEEKVDQVVSAVKAADDRVVDASARKIVTGLSWGWYVDVVLSGTEPVTPDELGAMLLAARHAGDGDPAEVDIDATDEQGDVVDLTAAADGLGVRYSEIGAGIGVLRDAIDDALGAGG